MSIPGIQRHCLIATIGLAIIGASASADGPVQTPAGPLTVVPAAVKLTDTRQPQSLLVLAKTQDGFALDLTDQATVKVVDESIAAVDRGWVQPLKSGETKIVIQAAGQTIEVPLAVTLPAAERPYSFRHEVMPVLSKGGCNMGACHGYSLGKGGFILSLRGANADQDYQAIFSDAQSRRLNLVHPNGSLLVRKPVGDVPHRGGTRFAKGSPSHDILVKWIEQGALLDADAKVDVDHVTIVPERFVLQPGTKHRLQLIAHYTDGTTRDVTRMGIYTVNTEGVADVTDSGLVSALEFGESAVVARFERKFAAARLIVLKPQPAFQPTPVPTDHFIDRYVVAKLNDLKMTPSDIAGDEEFLRRVHLDLIGLQPTPDEVRKFLADPNPTRRQIEINLLFARPEFVDHWSLKWGDLFQNSRVRLSDPAVYAFREWLRSAVASNMPMDDPAGAYFSISKDTNDTVERVAQVFCGVRMLCARCHPHPMENWTQADYFGMHSFFNQVTFKADSRLPNVQNTRSVMLQLGTGFSTNPRTGQPQPPRYLGGAEPSLATETDRRPDFAQWLTAKENPHFARSLTNRVWSYFFSRGIIDPVDDLRTTNPPINPELLDALTKDFVDHGFDIRHLMRTIVMSQTYQRTSVANESNRIDSLNFSHSIPRRVSAEALLDSLVQATGVRENFGGAPGGFSAAQLPDAEVTSEFLSLFGKPQRMEACECERDNDSNMLQALHLINGNSILRRVTDGNGRVAQLLKQHMADEPLIEDLYLWSLSRRPTPQEVQVANKHFETYGTDRAAAAQDLMWALFNSRDFLLVQ
jgi:uncharacterized protein DUF1553/uncharacterized protein DUF1549/hyaluronate lyase-like protein